MISFNRNKKRIDIGRANNCETRIIDISVSRNHSQLRKEKDGIWILDSNSKFGTLLYSFKPLLLKVDEPQYVQWGRSLLIFMVEKPWWPWWPGLVIPNDVLQGIEYWGNKNKFPEEYNVVYDEVNEDLIPIVKSLKKVNKHDRSNKARLKVIPINDTVRVNDLNIEVKHEISTSEPFALKISNNATMMETPCNIVTENKELTTKSRNRTRFQFNDVIPEHEEEGKGTIDFRNRTSLKESGENRMFMTHREETKHNRTESNQPLIKVRDEDVVENIVRINNIKQEDESSEESKHNEHYKESKNMFEDFEERKRSISAREPTRKIQFNNPELLSNGPLNVKQNNLFQPNSRTEMRLQMNEDEEDIDELINEFSQDLDHRDR